MRALTLVAVAFGLQAPAVVPPLAPPPPRVTIVASDDVAPPGVVLWYSKPAEAWTQALPVGNGRLGAMIFGGVREERIQLNEDSLWEGNGNRETTPQSAGSLARIRELLFDGHVHQGQDLAAQTMMRSTTSDSYQTLGDLRLESPLSIDATDYRRGLDLSTGVAVTAWRDREAQYVRTVYASHAVNAIIIRHESDEREGVFLKIALDRPPSSAGCALTITSEVLGERGVIRLRAATDPDPAVGVRFGSDIFIELEGGSLAVDGNAIVVRASNAVNIIVVAATDFPYVGDQRRAALAALRAGTPVARPSVEALLAQTIATLPSERRQLREDHERAWRTLFDRFDLELGPPNVEAEQLPTDERLQLVRANAQASDPGLITLYTQYARALLMSSSVRGGLPANLQGIWCTDLEAPWNADYHININLQMNYWPAEVLNIAPTVDPVIDFLDRLAVRGEEVARTMYGANGWMAHHATDAWCSAVPMGPHTVWGLWPHGGGWMTQTVHDHWDFSRDDEFLRTRAFPLLRGAAEFYLDYLTVDAASGKLVSGPSSSPENSFRLPDGSTADTGMGNTMDQMIIHDLFANLIEEATAMGADGMNDPVVVRAIAAIAKLKPPAIGADGRIMEWADAWDESEPGHRHMSHLFGVHPGRQITPEESPALMAAARKSLEFRLAHGGGHTGWSRAWLVSMFARLKDGPQAWQHMQMLVSKSTLPNLFDDHPPFQIDGNFGGAAGVAEMLVQSHREVGEGADRGHVLELLPALPAQWSRGSVRGLRARGAVAIDMLWTEGALLLATIQTSGSEPLRVAWSEQQPLPTILRASDSIVITPERFGNWLLVAPAGKRETFRISQLPVK
ncbi:MAG: glycoside hydrolase family 95 protein [Phycisphaerales bacterium]|nr:glycoside hydrolase family 95 protein [Phycisphaerales bacterium]